MTLQFQLLTMAAQLLAATLIIAGVLFLLGLVFEKPLTAFWERATESYANKQKEKNKRISSPSRLSWASQVPPTG